MQRRCEFRIALRLTIGFALVLHPALCQHAPAGGGGTPGGGGTVGGGGTAQFRLRDLAARQQFLGRLSASYFPPS